MKHRSYVGPPDIFDLIAANQFNILTQDGLRENSYLLDIGCGSLRAGRLFIPYLLPNHYFGVEPNIWLINDGIKYETGNDIILIKKPTFIQSSNFDFAKCNQKFDYLMAHSIFSHATIAQIKRCMQEAKNISKPTVKFYATFFEGDVDEHIDNWVYDGTNNIVKYTKKTMRYLAEEAGFDADFPGFPHPNKQVWMKMKVSQ